MNVFILGTSDSVENMNAAEIDLRDAGYTPVNPVKFVNSIHGLTEEQIADVGYALLSMCDAMYIVGGSMQSPILNQYIGYARAVGMAFWEPETLPYARADVQYGRTENEAQD